MDSNIALHCCTVSKTGWPYQGRVGVGEHWALALSLGGGGGGVGVPPVPVALM